MSYQALARKWRPQTFADVIGQETVVRTLQNAIESDRTHHAYLFSGVRGVGKTTAARILAKALNCRTGPAIEPCNECSPCREITEGIDLDVREIDAATYTQVDNIRELREVTQFQPARDRNRIFVIDEAHMLSTGAWNALLKLIEEPPPHVIFIMATTEMQKVPATILSRVQSFVFRKITEADVFERLRHICREESIDAEPAALEIIARRGEGSVRDSLSILDQVIAFSGRTISAADVATILGLSNAAFFSRLTAAVRDGDHAEILTMLEEAGESGRDFKLLYRDYLAFLRNVLLVTSGAAKAFRSLSPADLEAVSDLAAQFDYTEILRVLNLLIRDDETVSRAEHQRLAVEIAILKAATLPRLRSVEQILRTSGGPSPSPDEEPSRISERAVSTRPQQARKPAARTDGFLDRVRAQRKLTASYLDQARSSRLEESTLVFEFDSSQSFALDYLAASEQLSFLEETASSLYGRRITVRLVAIEKEAAPRDDARATVTEDPVLQAFAKHLGGEVISPSSAKRNREVP
ncbi:MAG TPA: DNA polymerase III subunit gamma/tau [Thermoanaerobaculia bacterium]|nr:DNA polymerase III subunit gamma/tau [Thermoanaerobaculia bacterium]